jgi:hypothetical protein
MRSGEFREDLYYRLNVVEIHVPPLRERPEGISSLARSFLVRYNAQYLRDVTLLPETVALKEGPTSQTRPTSDSLTLAISSSMAEPSIVCGWMASRATPRSA